MSWRNQHELAPFTPSPSPPPKRQRLTVPKKRKHICEFVFFSHSSTPPPPPSPVIAVLDEEFMNLCDCNPPRSPAGAAAVKELLESIDEEWDYFCLKKKAWEMSPSFLQAQTQRKMRVLMSLRFRVSGKRGLGAILIKDISVVYLVCWILSSCCLCNIGGMGRMR